MSTIIDVAREAAVSPMTVSRYFNQPDLLRPETRERVKTAVARLHYIPNQAARSLVQGRTNTIALIVTDITNPFYTTVARGVEDKAQEHGYTLILGNTDETLSKERRYLDVLISQRVDGVILSPAYGGEHNLEQLASRKIPVVLIDRHIPGVEADFVSGDSYDGGCQLVRHLVEQGYQDIGFIGGQAGVSSLEERLDGYRTSMCNAGLAEKVWLGRYNADSGRQIVARLIDKGKLPKAIIAANNLVAVGVLSELRRHGLRVPEDVALTCFDDIEVAALIDPFLTVVAQPAYDIGRLAMEMLLDRFTDRERPPQETKLPVSLIVRRSSENIEATDTL